MYSIYIIYTTIYTTISKKKTSCSKDLSSIYYQKEKKNKSRSNNYYQYRKPNKNHHTPTLKHKRINNERNKDNGENSLALRIYTNSTDVTAKSNTYKDHKFIILYST